MAVIGGICLQGRSFEQKLPWLVTMQGRQRKVTGAFVERSEKFTQGYRQFLNHLSSPIRAVKVRRPIYIDQKVSSHALKHDRKTGKTLSIWNDVKF